MTNKRCNQKGGLMSTQQTDGEKDWEFFFVQDASIGDANFPLGAMSEVDAEESAATRGPGFLYRKRPGDKNYQLWKPINK